MNTVRIAIAVAAAAAAVVLVAGPAVAAPSAAPASCGKGYACVFRDHSYGGTQVAFEYGIPDLRKVLVAGPGSANADNTTSSAYNNGRTHTAQFWADKNYNGPSFRLLPGYGDSNLNNSTGTVPVNFNDRVSSAQFVLG
ncbi:peptidase inhibitor family I36 [Frondihabitans sp. PhB188]|uniref:peptidase inhibitor family I36 protein n=1 Tax=Frondihabitans sp. PhB188 TaxID=2485200 RepID=UPI000FB785CD|nr:peptidase inhibitor family I36 protein [Frondihabitans sp. PhB188]ROQ38522.1 peptidase inhibitor family I36 [Frondihabitans sp. PhB188]